MRSQRRTKRVCERSVPKTISMSSLLLDSAQDKAGKMGYSCFSDYIQELVRKDTGVGVEVS